MAQLYPFSLSCLLISMLGSNNWCYRLYIDGLVKKDVTPLLTHWSYVFSALIHRYDDIMTWKRIRHYWYFVRELPWSPVDSTHKRAKNAELGRGESLLLVLSVTWGSISQTGFPSQFKFNGKFVLYHINFNIVISTKLCSCAVMACWKKCCDLMASNRITASQNSYRIWVTSGKYFVKRPRMNISSNFPTNFVHCTRRKVISLWDSIFRSLVKSHC